MNKDCNFAVLQTDLEVGCSEGNLQMDKKLGVGCNTRGGMVPGLGRVLSRLGC